jgi:hypothetical protein
MTHLYKIGFGSFLVLKEELEVASLQNDSRNLHRERKTGIASFAG